MNGHQMNNNIKYIFFRVREREHMAPMSFFTFVISTTDDDNDNEPTPHAILTRACGVANDEVAGAELYRSHVQYYLSLAQNWRSVSF